MSRRKPVRERVVISLGRRPIISHSALHAEVREVSEIALLLNDKIRPKVVQFQKRQFRPSSLLH